MLQLKGKCRRFGALLIAMSALITASTVAKEPYSIELVTDNVYRFSYQHYHSAFMVTDAGIIVTDPINPEAMSKNT
ncbi:hypothetical protein [Allohahella marinimesophila]|uniref:Uncharacterized protein n=1 Tax=Allohahella marinimesophila TaxID=1054972 RepID=A0ABP7NHF5_9GAMM